MGKEIKNCQNCKKDFTIEPEDFDFYEKIKVPAPTWCPMCRFQRRAIFRNERKFFRNIDAHTGEPLLSLFPKEARFPIYQDIFWAGDGWDPFSYGQEFDRRRPFLAQIKELSRKVPRYRSSVVNMVRSDYCANASDLKDCYLMFNSNFTEDSAYGNGVDFSKYCFDNSHIQNSEKCYESFWLTKCYETHFSSLCDECVSVWFSKNCRGCTNCFGCVNLINQSYCFFNGQLSKENYQIKLRDLKLSSWIELQKIKKKVKNFWLKFPVRYLQGVQNHNVSGEYITHSKNVRNGYIIRSGEDIAYGQYGQVPTLRNCMDVTVFGKNTELLYECSVVGWDTSQAKFCWECWDGGIDLEYCMNSGKRANHLFGCIGVCSGEYAILNRRYSKEEFVHLRDEIKKHMDKVPYIDQKGRVYKYGEFFPPDFSPFSYNDTIASEHFPMSQEEIIKYGSTYYEIPKNKYEVTIRTENLPDNINDVPDSFIGEVIECGECKRAFRIIPDELQFLKQIGIPLPHYCIDCRHKSRIMQRNKNRLYARTCMCNKQNHFHEVKKCDVEFETSYSPDRPEIIYCEKCYQQEVY